MLAVVCDLLGGGEMLDIATRPRESMATLCCQSEEWMHEDIGIYAMGANGRENR